MINLPHLIYYIAQASTSNTLNISPLPNSDGQKDYADSVWNQGLTIVYGIVGVMAVLLLVINGLLYITANGDPQRTAQARRGILFTVIGAVVALLAITIVTAVLKGIG